MRSENLFFSAMQFLLVLGMACAGLFLIALPYAPDIRVKLASLITEKENLLLLFGIGMLSLSFFLGIAFYLIQKKAYLQLTMTPSLQIEKSLLQDLLQLYWKEKFPKEALKTDVLMHPHQKIEFIAEFPSEKLEQRMLDEIENELSQRLIQQLGYRKDFIFTCLFTR